jgi:hypothetical protein
MNIIFRPLVVWPHNPSRARITWPADITLSKALQHLEQQLRLLGCRRDAYIEADVDEQHIRQDGQLRSTAVTRGTPGCIVYAEHPGLGSLRWACDGYRKLPHNIRAVSMTIQNLRAIDRYKCVRDSEQFRGFKALPTQSASSATTTVVAAVEVLARYAPRLDIHRASHETFLNALRIAHSATHPDRRGGNREAWDAVERAAATLRPLWSTDD